MEKNGKLENSIFFIEISILSQLFCSDDFKQTFIDQKTAKNKFILMIIPDYPIVKNNFLFFSKIFGKTENCFFLYQNR